MEQFTFFQGIHVLFVIFDSVGARSDEKELRVMASVITSGFSFAFPACSKSRWAMTSNFWLEVEIVEF